MCAVDLLSKFETHQATKRRNGDPRMILLLLTRRKRNQMRPSVIMHRLKKISTYIYKPKEKKKRGGA